MLCIISIQYPCRYDRILPLAIHHPELAEVGLGRARVLRLPVGRVTRDTWHHTRDIIHVWHVTLYTCDTCCPRYNEWRCPRAFHSHGVDCILQSQVCDGDKDCQDNVRTRAANDPSAKLQLYCVFNTVIPATLNVSLFRVTRRTAHTAPRVEPSSVRSRLNTGWSINMHHW